MSSEQLQFPPDPCEVTRINERSAELMSVAARVLCNETIDLAYDTIQVHLMADKERKEYLEGEKYPVGETREIFILKDRLGAPSKGTGLRRTLSARLEPENEQGEYLRVYVPIEESDTKELTLPPRTEISEVYVEDYEPDKAHWYAITTNGLYEYVPYAQQEDPTNSVLSDEEVWRWVNERGVPATTETIATILRKIINANTVLQRSIPIEEIPQNPTD